MTSTPTRDTIALPRHLQSWAALLAPIQPDLGADLAHMAQRITDALKQFFLPALSGQDEPDGYAGIARRGPPERLLLSEWALAEEFPDEFLRRAVMKEQLFLDPKRNAPHTPQWLTLLLDCGPMQWGSPRLAHLATLIVLTRYAAERQANLRWASLQLPDMPWQEGIDRDNLRDWLRNHQYRPADAAALDQWHERLVTEAKSDQQADTDLWLIGSSGLKQLADPTDGLILCEEPLDPACAGTLSLTIRRRTQSQTFSLPLPPQPVQVRLLRHPLRREEAAPSPSNKPRPDSLVQCRIQFSHAGRQLLVRQPLGRLSVYNIPDPGRYEPKIKVRRFDKGFQPILGAFSYGKRLLTLQAGQDGNLYFNCPGRWLRLTTECQLIDETEITDHGRLSLRLTTDCQLIDGAEIAEHARLTLNRQGWYQCRLLGDQVYFCDAGQGLWHYDGASPPQRIAERVVYFALHQNGDLIYLQHDATNKVFHWIYRKHGQAPLAANLPVNAWRFQASRQVILRHNWVHINVMAWAIVDHRWAVVHGEQYWATPPLPPACQILGIKSGADGEGGKPGLLCLNGAELTLQGENMAIRQRHFGTPPAAIAYDEQTDRIAWLSQEQELFVQELSSQRCLLQHVLPGHGDRHE